MLSGAIWWFLIAILVPAAIEAFRRMEKLRTQCTCPPIDWGGKYWGREECSACVERTRHHSVLHHEVGAKLWEWPCYYHPDDLNPYPVNSPAARSWDKDRAERTNAFKLYRELKDAARLEQGKRNLQAGRDPLADDAETQAV